MARVTMSDVWDEARAFVAREAALLLPLALATLGVASVLFDVARPDAAAGNPPPGPWLLVLAPVLLLLLFGNLALSLLVLVPRASVAEACRGALARLWRLVLATLLVSGGLLLASLPLVLVSAVAVAVGLGEVGQAVVAVLLIGAAFWIGVRLLPLVPLIAIGNPRGSPAAAVREAFALTRGHAGVLAGMLLLYALVSLVVVVASQLSLGALLLLVGRATGSATLGTTLLALLSAVVTSIVQGAWTVFVAVLARRLIAQREHGA